MDFEYFYNREAKRFNFLKVPEILVDEKNFGAYQQKQLSFIPYFLNRQECHLRITG
ncbi:phage protein, point mutation [Streptococcus pneumoniae]|nr:phage protein, point mutation [Streptococcus pneumoniae]